MLTLIISMNINPIKIEKKKKIGKCNDEIINIFIIINERL